MSSRRHRKKLKLLPPLGSVSGLPALPEDWSFYVDLDGKFLVDDNGNFYIGVEDVALPSLPSGFVFYVDSDGKYLIEIVNTRVNFWIGPA
jgi:hypothetical protein